MIHGEMEVLEETILLIMLSGPMDYNDPDENIWNDDQEKRE